MFCRSKLACERVAVNLSRLLPMIRYQVFRVIEKRQEEGERTNGRDGNTTTSGSSDHGHAQRNDKRNENRNTNQHNSESPRKTKRKKKREISPSDLARMRGELCERLSKCPIANNTQLRACVKQGVAYHHAGIYSCT